MKIPIDADNPTCKDVDLGDGFSISDHDWVETYNDGHTQVLKCKKCGKEDSGWKGNPKTDVV